MNLRFTLIALSLIVALSQIGCIALNVPSQRYHDPEDGGGLLGHWSNRANTHLQQPGCAVQHDAADVLMGEAIGEDPFDANIDGSGRPKPPEVPWPRFHPLPTRPVFGMKSL